MIDTSLAGCLMIVATVFMNWTGFAGLLIKGTYPIPSSRCDGKNDVEMSG